LHVLSALAAAAAGAAILSATRPEEASANAGPIGYTSNGFTPTITGENDGSGDGIYGTSVNPGGAFGVEGQGYQAGVSGFSYTGDGVLGNAYDDTGKAGVRGISGSAGGYGVLGDGYYGVYGQTSTTPGLDTGVAVFAEAQSSSAVGLWADNSGGGGAAIITGGTSSTPALHVTSGSNGTSVLGQSTGGGIGVSGATAGSNPAVQGVNSSPGPNAGPGVSGFSPFGAGVGGGTSTGVGFGGAAVGAGGVGVAGQATNASGYAGVFTGGRGVVINGPLTVMPNSGKSAAVRGKDGTLVRLYCMESPESWFEDFGFGQLSNGKVTVNLEPGFTAVVKTDSYHVFLTAHGETNGLHVTDRTPNSFTVHEGHGGTSTVSFSYRIVAKRKDIEGKRLEHVDEPPTIDLSKLAEPPAMPPTAPTPPKTPTYTPPGHSR
jgi:hypothetical protein